MVEQFDKINSACEGIKTEIIFWTIFDNIWKFFYLRYF